MDNQMKSIAILGSTGSIGQQTLDVVGAFPDRFRVVALAGRDNSALLAKQVAQLQPRMVYSAKAIDIHSPAESLSMEEIAAHPDVDLVVIATSGKAGLRPTLAAIRAGKQIALANKEVLVLAGKIITSEAKQYGAQILPIDSEHSAIWQCLHGEQSQPARIILTASGGPFYGQSPEQLAKVTPKEALSHPTWKMGRKVTIDSATLMNKGLEAIEAHWLFSIPFDHIEIIIHRQSIIHSLVEFADGSTKAQLSFPDMRLPIQYALSYPERLPNAHLPHLNLTKVKALTFEPVNPGQFPCLKLALEAGKEGGTCPAVLSAADEVAVNLFLAGKARLTDIAELITQTITRHHPVVNPSLEEILAADIWARQTVEDIAKRKITC
ncbi:MAG: 1-deoxy-D-xylulose-5-phosphate reductoisomerase [Chloroflexi bacterium]|nr:1-deoxy-D-xylulose-5-phosphate reductoisomerase [Chloroflexota bacterium]MBM4454443.1 1-deoxy-D-xylulose-5-phosphate reductoisomerase [Chloroflexota bacterium]